MTIQLQAIKQSVVRRLLSKNLNKITTYMLIFSIAIGIVTALFWYDRVFLNEERRFWNAIGTSLSTPSVTRTLTQGGSGNQVIQDYRFHFSPQQVIENNVDFINRSATENIAIQTEGRVYPQEQYLRYSQFSNTDSDGNQISNIDNLLGQWAFQEGQGQGGSEEDNRVAYLGEYVTLALFGNYDANYRADVIRQLRDNNVYSADFNNVLEQDLQFDDTKQIPVISYQIRVSLKQYADILNKSFIKAGYGNFPPLDPANYEEGQTVAGVIHVSKINGTIVGIDFGGREERYSNYGVMKQVEKPEAIRTVQELQDEVQQRL